MSDYKVCLLAAGIGSRMGELTVHLNKAILPVNFKGVISYMIEKFPKDVEIVIAVGYLKDTIINYLSAAHPDRKFTFVDVDRYTGPGTGPGYSLLQCKKELQCPFVFFACDTLVKEDIPEPVENWFGLAEVEDTSRFCSSKVEGGKIVKIDDKIKTDNKFAFIGLAGIKDYEHFWTNLNSNKDIIAGEIQVSNGFKSLIEKNMSAKVFTWFDTGTLESYEETNKIFMDSKEQFDFGKGDEFIYFVGNRVIKFFSNKDVAKNRAERARLLGDLVPKIVYSKDDFYAYEKVDGELLYDALNASLFKEFLSWSKSNLWKEKKLDKEESEKFRDACKDFYYDKTMKRIDIFYKKTNTFDEEDVINGIMVPPLRTVMKAIDWNDIFSGTPVRFHGDFNFGNVLVDSKRKFVLLDWRQDFSGILEYGDLYYDFAKLYGGMIIAFDLIKQNKFSFSRAGKNISYKFPSKDNLDEARGIFEAYVTENGFDLNKIKILTAITFLNMSPLHHEPYGSMIYYTGKHMLYKVLNTTKERLK